MHPRKITPVLTLCAALALVGCGAPSSSDRVALTLSAKASTSESGKVSLDVLEIEAQVDGAWTPISRERTPLELALGQAPNAAALGALALPPGHLTALRLTLDLGSVVGESKHATNHGHTITVTAGCDHHIPQCVSGTLALEIQNLLAIIEDLVGQNAILQLASADLEEHECKPDMGKHQSDASMAHADLASFDAADPLCIGVVCAPNEVCRAGECVPTDSCVGVVCAPGEVCVSGSCVVPTDMAHAADMAHATSGSGDMANGCGDGHHGHHY
jgi:hypothetical protein